MDRAINEFGQYTREILTHAGHDRDSVHLVFPRPPHESPPTLGVAVVELTNNVPVVRLSSSSDELVVSH